MAFASCAPARLGLHEQLAAASGEVEVAQVGQARLGLAVFWAVESASWARRLC